MLFIPAKVGWDKLSCYLVHEKIVQLQHSLLHGSCACFSGNATPEFNQRRTTFISHLHHNHGRQLWVCSEVAKLCENAWDLCLCLQRQQLHKHLLYWKFMQMQLWWYVFKHLSGSYRENNWSLAALARNSKNLHHHATNWYMVICARTVECKCNWEIIWLDWSVNCSFVDCTGHRIVLQVKIGWCLLCLAFHCHIYKPGLKTFAIKNLCTAAMSTSALRNAHAKFSWVCMCTNKHMCQPSIHYYHNWIVHSVNVSIS